ncbi:uncharacterized protein BDW70DRAFT_144133 [Aspergillus foveolatus]|uniref:uncharacterized protein n=1 Tax=Aspergillus foveolatus TaxID=210207 RepID=UPI003CCDFDA8
MRLIKACIDHQETCFDNCEIHGLWPNRSPYDLPLLAIFVLALIPGILTAVHSTLHCRMTVRSYELSLAAACQQRSGPARIRC